MVFAVSFASGAAQQKIVQMSYFCQFAAAMQVKDHVIFEFKFLLRLRHFYFVNYRFGCCEDIFTSEDDDKDFLDQRCVGVGKGT